MRKQGGRSGAGAGANMSTLTEISVPAHGEANRILHRAIRAREGGPWLAFRDDQLTTYWYHLDDKVVTHENPYL